MSRCDIHSSVVVPWLHAAIRAITRFLPELLLTPVLDESLRKEKNKLVETALEQIIGKG